MVEEKNLIHYIDFCLNCWQDHPYKSEQPCSKCGQQEFTKRPVRKHAVWPCKVPLVSSAGWSLEGWMRHEDGDRPKWYLGDRYDGEAWEKTLEERRAATR